MNTLYINYTKDGNNLVETMSWDDPDFDEVKQIHSENLKQQYLEDVLWTDDAKIFYDKFKLAFPNSTSQDAWFADVMNYWAESQNERISNKVALSNANTIEAVLAIIYSPNHAKPEMKP
jgi:hypothetical protein